MSNQQMNNMVELLRVGQLALDLCAAEQRATLAKDSYHARVREYELNWNLGERIKLDPRNPNLAALFKYTDKHYAAAQAAKRAVYLARRKLRLACQRATGGGA